MWTPCPNSRATRPLISHGAGSGQHLSPCVRAVRCQKRLGHRTHQRRQIYRSSIKHEHCLWKKESTDLLSSIIKPNWALVQFRTGPMTDGIKRYWVLVHAQHDRWCVPLCFIPSVIGPVRNCTSAPNCTPTELVLSTALRRRSAASPHHVHGRGPYQLWCTRFPETQK